LLKFNLTSAERQNEHERSESWACRSEKALAFDTTSKIQFLSWDEPPQSGSRDY